MTVHRSHSEGRSCPAFVSNFARIRTRWMGEVQYLTLNMCQKMGDKIVPAAPSGTVADVRSVPTSTGMQVWAKFISMHDLASGQAHRQTAAARLGVRCVGVVYGSPNASKPRFPRKRTASPAPQCWGCRSARVARAGRSAARAHSGGRLRRDRASSIASRVANCAAE
jgi:hypothetical protein